MAKLIIESGRSEGEYWRDLWRYRELFHVLAWRDISVRYKQTAIGVLWALIQPLVTMIILTIVFSRVAKMSSLGFPYPLFVFAGLLPWQFVAGSLTGASQSLVGSANLISKVYFPRLIIPAGAVVTSLVDFGISFALMACTMAWFHFLPPWQIVFLPLFVVFAFLTALGPGLLITALNVKYRDFRYIIPFITQFGLYASPVPYGTFNFSHKIRLLFSLNPMVGVIDGFRWCLLGGGNRIYVPGMIVSLAVCGFFLLVGVWYFRKTERTFADII
jgi:lipopolysaccharide transport system permease protein